MFTGLGFAASAVSAQTTINEPFDSPLDGIPADWTSSNETFAVDPIIVDSSNEVASVQDIGPSDGTWLQSHRDTSSTASDSPPLPIFYTGGLVQDVTSGSVTVRWGAANSIAFTQAQVFLRAEGTTSQNPTEGYNITIARLRQEGSNETVFRLGIGKPGGESMRNDADALGTGWADLGLSNFNTNENYRLDFSIVGNNIAAEVFAEDGLA